MKTPSKKDCAFISEAAVAAEESPILMRHGAVAVSNGKIIAKGYNHYRSTAHTGTMGGCTCHAECSVLHKLQKIRNSSNSNNTNKMKRITMYITRIGQDGELRESAPCHDCYEKMLFFGIKTIVFTKEPNFYVNNLKKDHNNNNNHDITIVKYNIDEFNPNVVTAGQRWISKTLK